MAIAVWRLSLALALVAVTTPDRPACAQTGDTVTQQAVPAAPPPTVPGGCTGDFLNDQAPSMASNGDGPGNSIFCHSFYAVLYSSQLKDPLWTSYRLTRDMAKGGDIIGRYNGKFVHQVGLAPALQGDHDDYKSQPFDRGHMTPANDAIDMPHQTDTFVVTNIVPQRKPLNEQLWRFLEASVHQLAEQDGEVYIVTGPVFAPNPDSMHGIAVPADTFKAIFDPVRQIAIAYVATNEDAPRCAIVSLADLQQHTGIDVFPSLPAVMKAVRPNFTLPHGIEKTKTGQLVQLPLPNCH
jgi:endonuclease G